MPVSEIVGSIQSQAPAVTALMDCVGSLPVNDRTFANSLIARFHDGKSLSEKQLFWVGELTKRATAPKTAPAVLMAEGAWECFMLIGVDEVRPAIALAFTIDGKVHKIRLSHRVSTKGQYLAIETATAEKPVKADWSYVGSILPSGSVKPLGKFAEKAFASGLMGSLEEFTADPVKAIKAFGLATGVCGACGRSLSDPVSVSIGIGPVCRAKLGGMFK